MSSEVFISYSSKDEKVAKDVCELLEESGLSCWIAYRSIKTGDYFAKEITDAINDCKLFVLISSKNSLTSNYVLKEVEAAYAEGKAIISFNIDETLPKGSMMFCLNDKQWLYAYPNPSDYYDKLVSDAHRIYNDVLAGNYKDPGFVPPPQHEKKSFFEEHKSAVIASVAIILILVVALVVFGGPLFNSGDSGASQSKVSIDYIQMDDDSNAGYAWKYSYFVFGSITDDLKDPNNVIHLDFMDNSSKVITSNDTKVKDVDDSLLGMVYADSKDVSQVSIEVKDGSGKVLATGNSTNIQ